MSRATEEILAQLHNALTLDLIKRIESGGASAADLGVAAKLLKDNSITCVPTTDNAMGELEEKMKAQREKRKHLRAVPSEIDEIRRRAMGGT